MWSTAALNSVYFLLDLLPYGSERTLSTQLFAQSWCEKRGIHAFLKGISTKWNRNSFVQDLNFGLWFHFLRY